MGVIIVIVMLLFVFTKLPDIKHEDDGDKSKISHAWRHKHLRWAVVAQFFYVGAQVCVLSFYTFCCCFSRNYGKNAAFYSGLAGLAFMVGRFVGTFFMKYVKPNKLLMIYAVLSMLLTLVAVFGKGNITIYALIG